MGNTIAIKKIAASLISCFMVTAFTIVVQLTFSIETHGDNYEPASSQNAGKIVAGTKFTSYRIVDPEGRPITYHLSPSKEIDAPLLIMIQGSGCVPVVSEVGGNPYSTIFNLFVFSREEKFSVMAVEKPYSGMEQIGEQRTCSEKFNENFSADSWLSALQESINDARKKLKSKTNRTLVMGVSEGATMAALLAAHDEQISDVVMIGGSGTTQIFDFIARDYENCFNVSTCLDTLDKDLSDIYSDPLSTNKFKWGHTYKRWSSFFKIDSSNELLKSQASVYIAFGTRDNATPPISQEIIYAKMKAANRKIKVRRVIDANHGLMNESNPNINDLDIELRKALEWFWLP